MSLDFEESPLERSLRVQVRFLAESDCSFFVFSFSSIDEYPSPKPRGLFSFSLSCLFSKSPSPKDRALLLIRFDREKRPEWRQRDESASSRKKKLLSR